MPPKTKTADEYEAEIRKLYPKVKLLKNHCETNPEDITTAKELEKKKNTLRWNRDQWAKRIQIIVYRASNEQLPNSADELKCDIEPMPTYNVKKWPYYQFGDYQAFIPSLNVWYPVVRERKTLNDLHGTLVDKDHRQNLFEEFERFKLDPRFAKDGIFRGDFECFEEEFYNYLPPTPKNCNFCEVKRSQTSHGDYICIKTMTLFQEKEPPIGFHCYEPHFVEKKKDPIDKTRLKSLKKKIVDQCFEMGIQIKWRGSRQAACEAYRSNIETWLKLNYVRLLGLDLDPIKDHQRIRREIAYLKAELLSKETSLKNLEKQLGIVEVLA